MSHFSSEAELQAFLKRVTPSTLRAVGPVPAPPAAEAVQSVIVSASRIQEAGITNNQEAGVDEGDIVKLHGQHLVVLRRGRLFTISLADGGLKPVSTVNAYPPGVNADGDWYDEMLVSGDRVIVIGYSYERGGTQINRFHIDANGDLSFEDAYQLRSSDYYSSRNYASRLIGQRLVLYSARDVYAKPEDILPGLRRWNGTGTAPRYRRIPSARHVYIPAGIRDDQINALHSVIDCDLRARVLACRSISVFGAEGRVFYVAADAAYVHAELYNLSPRDLRTQRTATPSVLYRLPLNGGAPAAIGVRGMPVDQFSFRADKGGLDLFLTPEGSGDIMWASLGRKGQAALARVSLKQFGDGGAELPSSSYRILPPLDDESYDVHNRFVGDWLLYGSGNGFYGPVDEDSPLRVVSTKTREEARFMLPHGVDRIEVMGDDAVVVGSDRKKLYFLTVLLGEGPRLGSRYELDDATQAESRSHGFFFQPAAQGNGDGMLGLPVARAARPAYKELFENSAAVLFLARTNKVLAPAGELEAQQEGVKDDGCQASCVDWYGNARPIFVGARIFALMGYELVEGRMRDGKMTEIARVSFAPAASKTQ